MHYTGTHIHHGGKVTVSAAEREKMEAAGTARNYHFAEAKEPAPKPAKIETTGKQGADKSVANKAATE